MSLLLPSPFTDHFFLSLLIFFSLYFLVRLFFSFFFFGGEGALDLSFIPNHFIHFQSDVCYVTFASFSLDGSFFLSFDILFASFLAALPSIFLTPVGRSLFL